MRISLLPARHGDCIWVEWDDGGRTRRLLVDGGPRHALPDLQARLPAGSCRFELLVVTHVDTDHIGGVLGLLTHLPDGVDFGDVWFNGWKHLPTDDELGPAEGELFSAVIERRRLPWNRAFRGGPAARTRRDGFRVKRLGGGMTVTLLSPSRAELARLRPVWEKTVRENGLEPGSSEDALAELAHREDLPPDLLGDETIDPARDAGKPFVEDDSEANASSIVLLLEQGERRVLLCGDAYPSLVVPVVERLARDRGEARLRLDALKISHHASKKNIDNSLLAAVDCDRYLVSTNGAHYKHPHAAALSRVVVHGGERTTLCFNYDNEHTKPWRRKALRERYGYSTVYPDGAGGLTVEL